MSAHSSLIRVLIIAIFHTLVWVFAMFLADSIWGDAVSRVLVAPFIIANTILALFLYSAIRRTKSQSSE